VSIAQALLPASALISVAAAAAGTAFSAPALEVDFSACVAPRARK
jgi:hypothetical protein